MRQGDILLEGSVSGYQPLGAFGQPVHQSYVQLRAAIERKLGPRYANFFAKPQLDERSQTIRWVAPIAGTAVSWRDLSPADQADRALDLQIMRAEFERYREELLRESQPTATGRPSGGQAFAAVLEQALKTPNDAHLHFVGDQPVATFWGFSEPGKKPFDPLTAAPPPANVPPPPPLVEEPAVPVVPPKRRWWAWLLWPLLLLLLILLLLFLFWPRDFELGGWKPPVTLQSVLHPEEKKDEPVFKTRDGRTVVERDGLYYDASGRLVDRSDVILDGVAGGTGTVDGIKGDVGASDGQGGATAPKPDAGPDTGMPAGDQPKDADGEQGKDAAADQPMDQGKDPADAAQQPDMPKPPKPDVGKDDGKDAGKDAGKDGDNPPPTGQNAPAGPPLTIPSNAVAGSGNGPADFLAGRWHSETGLVDQDTGAKLSQTYQFDKNGEGRSTVKRSNGMECGAPARAVMRNGKLEVEELANLSCPDGQAFEKSTTTCTRGANGQTSCTGANAGGTGYEVKIDRAGS